jgi:hypothetical protein
MRPNASPTDDDDFDDGLLLESTFFGGSFDDDVNDIETRRQNAFLCRARRGDDDDTERERLYEWRGFPLH